MDEPQDAQCLGPLCDNDIVKYFFIFKGEPFFMDPIEYEQKQQQLQQQQKLQQLQQLQPQPHYHRNHRLPLARKNSKIQFAMDSLRIRRQEAIIRCIQRPRNIEWVFCTRFCTYLFIGKETNQLKILIIFFSNYISYKPIFHT